MFKPYCAVSEQPIAMTTKDNEVLEIVAKGYSTNLVPCFDFHVALVYFGASLLQLRFAAHLLLCYVTTRAACGKPRLTYGLLCSACCSLESVAFFGFAAQ